jgi:hypothetical protein
MNLGALGLRNPGLVEEANLDAVQRKPIEIHGTAVTMTVPISNAPM